MADWDNFKQDFFAEGNQVSQSRGFKEGNIAEFGPTFKIQPNEHHYLEKRLPSWTDRIIYKSSRHKKTQEEILSLVNYDSNTFVRISDHNPVFAQFMLKTGIKSHVS